MNSNSHLLFMVCIALLGIISRMDAAEIAYIHGNIDIDGDYPGDAGYTSPFHQMLLTDTGKDGCSMLKGMVEEEGHRISQHYDVEIDMGLSFLNQFDVLVFGLHQRVWSNSEWIAIDTWLRDGGSIFMYSDSAAGGRYDMVPGGIANTVGQDAVNSILSHYGMQVTIDNGGGTRAYASDITSPLDIKDLVLEGEGVSPIAVDVEGTNAIALIPLSPDNLVYESKDKEMPHDTRNITIDNPTWACLAYNGVGNGKVVAMFDRQPMWNDGGGSNIQQADNMEILRRVVNFLAEDGGVNTPASVTITSHSDGDPIPTSESDDVVVTFTAMDNSGIKNIWVKLDDAPNYTIFAFDPQASAYQWSLGSLGPGNHTVRVRAKANDDDVAFQKITIEVMNDGGNDSPQILSAVTATSTTITLGQTTELSVFAEDADGDALTYTWSKVSGSGAVTFSLNGDGDSYNTVADFLTADTYELEVVVSDGNGGTATSSIVITVNPGAELTVSFDSPTVVNNVPAEEDVIVTVSTTEGISIKRVWLQLDGQTPWVGYVETAPYQWNLGRLSLGDHTLVARAFPVVGDHVDSEITITVVDGGTQTETFLEIKSPENGNKFPASEDILIEANAGDDSGIKKVWLRVDGGDWVASVTADPYTWNIGNLTVGDHDLRVNAVPVEGEIASQKITITVTP